MHAVVQDSAKVEQTASLRGRAPAPARSRISRPPAVHELDLVAGRRAALTEQRCSCGAILGPDGECAACRAAREAAEAATGDVEQIPDEESGVLWQANNGETICSFPDGTPSTTVSNTACSRTCTEEHEAVHAADITPCCSAAGTAFRAATTEAAKKAVRRSFVRWLNANRSFFECRAYGVSVVCANRLIGEKKCGKPDMAEGDRECCTNLAAYRTDKEARRKSNCDAAGDALTDCPFS
jgi:hypothetical protein